MTAIKTQGLTKKYGALIALDHLDLEVPDNVVFGFLGPNGAGKTTTVRILTGFAAPSSGACWVAGEKVGDGNLALRAKTGLVPDVPSFYPWMTGLEFLHFVGELHGLDARENRKRADELIEIVELKKAAARRIGGYSRGMRQRLGIAQALVNRPRVLFMDEPTSALDPIGRRDVLGLIERLAQTATIFMSTHILSDVDRVCGMVGIVNKGRLLTVSTVESLREKYAPSIFEVEFIEDGSQFADSLRSVPWIAESKMILDGGNQKLRVRAASVDRARMELPRLIAQSGLTLCRYELITPDLEEIFMEIVSPEAAA